jgi:hypothetical protein
VPNHAAIFFNGLEEDVDLAGKNRLSFRQKKRVRRDYDRVVLAESAPERLAKEVGLADA